MKNYKYRAALRETASPERPARFCVVGEHSFRRHAICEDYPEQHRRVQFSESERTELLVAEIVGRFQV
ncbi:hypothetical protein DBR06_SOUSAS30410122 [Sousa chinensis]|nr:hypothetical protein DBR06_SOUSAS30410122 [Sousa chinensis]